MTSFVHVDYSSRHAGADRLESAIESAQNIKRNLSTTRSLATLLLSAIAAAVMVAAYQVMQSMADGHLLVLWMGMWAVAFTVLAVFAGTARRVVFSAKSSLDTWSRNIAIKRADERLWAMAKTDPRLMADLQAVMTRNGADESRVSYVAPVVKTSDWLSSLSSTAMPTRQV